MSKQRVALYCWDTSVFLAWINSEKSAPLADIKLVAEEVSRGDARLVVPVTIATEVLQSRMTKSQKETFEHFLKHQYVVLADTTLAIAQKAAAIREAGLVMQPKRKIKTPDATILATAIVHNCDALHSLDNRGSGHLRLAGHPILGSLEVTAPRLLSGQKALPLD